MTAMSTKEVSYLQNRHEELVGRTLTLNDAIHVGTVGYKIERNPRVPKGETAETVDDEALP
jgi:hypothetical protein